MLKDGGRVGIINACLRLKMVFGEQVAFDIEGEQGVGTTRGRELLRWLQAQEHNGAGCVV